MQKQLFWIKVLLGAATGTAFTLLSFELQRFGPAGSAATWLLAICGGAAIAVIGARWREQSITDDGTGLFNRRYLFRRLAQTLDHANRHGKPISLIVIDIDDFRQYNSRFGHMAGDSVLLAIAQTLCTGVRKGDVVGRWGGEEFALVLPDADQKEAIVIAERIRIRIDQLNLELSGTLGIKVTISAGVTACGANDRISLPDFVERADRAMYTAKQRKNFVMAG